MTLNDLIKKLETLANEGDTVEIDTVTLLDGDWLAVSGWAIDRDGNEREFDVSFQ